MAKSNFRYKLSRLHHTNISMLIKMTKHRKRTIKYDIIEENIHKKLTLILFTLKTLFLKSLKLNNIPDKKKHFAVFFSRILSEVLSGKISN